MGELNYLFDEQYLKKNCILFYSSIVFMNIRTPNDFVSSVVESVVISHAPQKRYKL